METTFPRAWTIAGLLLQGNVVLQSTESIHLALNEGYGAKYRQDVEFPPVFQHVLFKASSSVTALPSSCADGDKIISKSECNNTSLTLCDEEAAYLMVSGSLVVTFPDNQLCSCDEAWNIFCQKNIKFVANYKVYHFYRTQGYFIRSGIHYGVDFSVYRDDPTRCHSEMCVMVVSDGSIGASSSSNSSGECSSSSSGGSDGDDMSWRGLTALTRLIPDVMKLLVLCYVIKVEKEGEGSMECMKAYTDEYLSQWAVRPVTVISRRLNNRSEDFATIGNIQRKYQQQSKVVVTRKNQNNSKSQKRKTRRPNNGSEDKKRQKVVVGGDSSNSVTSGSTAAVLTTECTDGSSSNNSSGSSNNSSWSDYVGSFFSSR